MGQSQVGGGGTRIQKLYVHQSAALSSNGQTWEFLHKSANQLIDMAYLLASLVRGLSERGNLTHSQMPQPHLENNINTIENSRT